MTRQTIHLPVTVTVKCPEDWTEADARDLLLFHLNLTDLDYVEVDVSAADVTAVHGPVHVTRLYRTVGAGPNQGWDGSVGEAQVREWAGQWFPGEALEVQDTAVFPFRLLDEEAGR